MLYLSEENLPHHLTLIVFHFVATLKTEANLSAKQCMTERKKKSLCYWYSYPPGSKSGDQSIGSIFCAAVWIFFHFDETIFLDVCIYTFIEISHFLLSFNSTERIHS